MIVLSMQGIAKIPDALQNPAGNSPEVIPPNMQSFYLTTECFPGFFIESPDMRKITSPTAEQKDNTEN